MPIIISTSSIDDFEYGRRLNSNEFCIITPGTVFGSSVDVGLLAIGEGISVAVFGSLIGGLEHFTGTAAASLDLTVGEDGLMAGAEYGFESRLGFRAQISGEVFGGVAGIFFEQLGTAPCYIQNSGLIHSTNYGIQAGSDKSLSLINTGTIAGNFASLILGNAADFVSNAGILSNAAALGGGDDVYDGANARAAVALDCGTGNDSATGGAFADYFYSTGGNDGDDTIDGGGGIDTYDFGQLFTAVRVDLANGTARGSGIGYDLIGSIESIAGGAAADRLIGSEGDDTLSGNAGADRVSGGNGNDRLNGGADNDSLDGGGGNDRLVGGTGNDTMTGGSGSDVLLGGAGIDTFTGGNAADVFVFSARSDITTTETITDFVQGADLIDLSGIDSNAGISFPGDQDFSFIGAAGFTASGQLRAVISGTTTQIALCDNFASQPAGTVILTLTSVLTLTAGDFVL